MPAKLYQFQSAVDNTIWAEHGPMRPSHEIERNPCHDRIGEPKSAAHVRDTAEAASRAKEPCALSDRQAGAGTARRSSRDLPTIRDGAVAVGSVRAIAPSIAWKERAGAVFERPNPRLATKSGSARSFSRLASAAANSMLAAPGRRAEVALEHVCESPDRAGPAA